MEKEKKKNIIKYLFYMLYKLTVFSAIVLPVKMPLIKPEFFHTQSFPCVIRTKVEVNKLHNRGTERAKVTSLLSLLCYLFPTRVCTVIYYLHEGRNNSNEAIIRQEYLINGSNIFTKMYYRQSYF